MWPWPAVLHSLPPSCPVYLCMLLSRLPLRSSSGLVRWPVPRVGFTALELEYRENKLPINEVNIQIQGHPSQNTKSEELQSHTSVIRLSVGTLENLGMKGSFGESGFSVNRWWQPPASWKQDGTPTKSVFPNHSTDPVTSLMEDSQRLLISQPLRAFPWWLRQ